MGGKFTARDMNQRVVERGYFYGLETMLREYQVPTEQAMKLKRALVEHLLTEVRECKNEISRLQSSILRLESACRSALVPKPAEAQEAFSPPINKIIEEMRTFDGWVISLLESDISLLNTVINPDTGAHRVKSLQDSFTLLYHKRVKSGNKPFDNYPHLFDLEITVVLDR